MRLLISAASASPHHGFAAITPTWRRSGRPMRFAAFLGTQRLLEFMPGKQMGMSKPATRIH